MSTTRPGERRPGDRVGHRATLLLLTDGRTPSGGHAHSGGVEAAVVAGDVATVEDLERFLRGRLATAGRVAAAFAAHACRQAWEGRQATETETAATVAAQAVAAAVAELDEELDARTPSPAQRAASRAQGRSLLRTATRAWPGIAVAPGPAPHYPIAVGLAAAAGGLCPGDAALAAAFAAVTGPASAANRLLGLDPLAVTALLARLAADMDDLAERAAAECDAATGDAATRMDPRRLPATTGIRLDLLAEAHRQAQVRMFAS